MAARLFAAPQYAPLLSRRRIRALVVGCLAAIVLVLAMSFARQPLVFDDRALAAAQDMREGMRAIRTLRDRLAIPVESAIDPAESGLIGIDYSDLTTTLGDLRAKQTSLNPQFASLIVAWLEQSGVRPGDKVALSLTGSFPALNMAALYACAALELVPVIFSSVGASSYGANIPGLTWLDMERHLNAEGLLPWRSQYASLGGIVETEGGLDGTGYAVGEAAIARHGARYLREEGPRSLVADMERRHTLYFAAGPPKVFINIGGSITALGWVPEAALLNNGLLTHVPRSTSAQRGLIFRMAEEGVPVIHLINIERLAADHHLPIAPTSLDEQADPAAGRQAYLLSLCTVLLGWLGIGAGGALRRRDIRERHGRPRLNRFRSMIHLRFHHHT